MQYRYETTRRTYEDLASGRVLYNAPGLCGFPVRLASEVLMRCFAILEKHNNKDPYIIYDPCCGGGYLLTILGFLYGKKLKNIYASDSDLNVLIMAKKNLSLLQIEGLNKRINELNILVQNYNKPAHIEALKSSINLLNIIMERKNFIDINCFENDITNSSTKIFTADIITIDLPYGQLTNWQSNRPDIIQLFFSNIIKYLKPHSSVLAIIADKNQKLIPVGLKKIEKFKLGKRQIIIFQLIS